MISQRKLTIRLSQAEYQDWRIAIEVQGGSQTAILRRMIRSVVVEARRRTPQAFVRFNWQQHILLQAIDLGYQTAADIERATGLKPGVIRRRLTELLANGSIEEREQGGKTTEARGARKKLYIRTK